MQMKYSAQYLERIKDSLNVSYCYYFKVNKALCIPAQVLEDPSVETSRETMNNDGWVQYNPGGTGASDSA